MKKCHCIKTAAICVLLLLGWSCAQKPAEEGIHTVTELKRLFADPPSEYRSAPLWDWNEQITEEGIDFQMREFKKAGIGGVFVHPRPGLLTEYLSEEWFHLFDYTVQKGTELGMKVWIYDENSYPSGFAGGHVPAEMPDSYRHGAGLRLEIQEELNIQLSDTIAVVLKKSESGFEDITGSAAEEMGKKGNYYVFRKTYPDRSPWYGGFSYVDLLYDGVTDKFLELTMTRGYEKNKADFGKTLPGVFTDEPNLEAALSQGAFMRWTPDLWDAFEKRWGYDLKVNLPSLAEKTGDWKRVRNNYYKLLLEMFIDRWSRPWYAYCEENGLAWTGHYWEHGWPEPTDGIDEAAFYIFHQMPGVDMLGNRLDEEGLGGQFGNDRAVRELLSAANQAGRTRTLSETYGGGGWEMSFSEQKRLADWQGVLGVNFVNQHLSYYSLNGVRKFDYPPSFSYHEPWWEYYPLLGDYIGRLSMAMSTGQQINQTLVLQPNTSAWMYFSRRERDPFIYTIRDGFKKFVYQLEQQHVEYDLGSEYVLKELGSVNGNKLRVGKRDYDLLVIPAEMENIDKATYELLLQYVKGGGRILSFRTDIPLIDGAPSGLANQLFKTYADNCVFAQSIEDQGVIEMLSHDDFVMTDHTKNGMLYHQRRITDDGQVLLVVNSHPDRPATADITVSGKYVSKLSLTSGNIHRYPAVSKGGKVTFSVYLDPAGSALFTITNKKPDEPDWASVTGRETVMQKAEGPIVKRESDNVLMINYLDLKTAKSEKREIYFMNALESLFRENGVSMGNPWQHKIQYKQNYLELDSLFKDGSWFEAAYHFNVDASLGSEAIKTMRAVVERPGLWTVSINGQEVEQIAGSYWIDRDFPMYAIGEHVKQGRNTLTLKAPRMHVLAEVMPVYILGEFLVTPGERGFQISGGDITETGSWRSKGLPFYSQKVAYTQTYALEKSPGASFKVKLNQWSGTAAGVLVNGEEAGLIAWQPYELDVTSLMKEGSNNITVRVTGSLKNTFGFFYQDNNSWIFGPHSWNYAPEKAPDASAYFLMDYGLMQPFDLVMVN
jgi:hypothetical protein